MTHKEARTLALLTLLRSLHREPLADAVRTDVIRQAIGAVRERLTAGSCDAHRVERLHDIATRLDSITRTLIHERAMVGTYTRGPRKEHNRQLETARVQAEETVAEAIREME